MKEIYVFSDVQVHVIAPVLRVREFVNWDVSTEYVETGVVQFVYSSLLFVR